MPRDSAKEAVSLTRIDIVKDGGVVVQTNTPTPTSSVRCTQEIHDSTARYDFVRVWNAGSGDAPAADPTNPIARLAPVWTGR